MGHFEWLLKCYIQHNLYILYSLRFQHNSHVIHLQYQAQAIHSFTSFTNLNVLYSTNDPNEPWFLSTSLQDNNKRHKSTTAKHIGLTIDWHTNNSTSITYFTSRQRAVLSVAEGVRGLVGESVTVVGTGWTTITGHCVSIKKINYSHKSLTMSIGTCWMAWQPLITPQQSAIW